MNLFDSSALLCFLRGEEGADVVERELLVGGACSAANWSEVAQKVAQREHDWRPARALLLSYGLTVEPVVIADAEAAARLWQRGSGLSWATACAWRQRSVWARRCGRRTPHGAPWTRSGRCAEHQSARHRAASNRSEPVIPRSRLGRHATCNHARSA